MHVFCVADVIGFITTVGKSSQPRIGSKKLDFALINERYCLLCVITFAIYTAMVPG